MVQRGSPEEYFGTTQQIVIPQPMETKLVEPIEAKIIEPVNISNTLQTDNTPLILAICFLGAVSIGLVIVIGLHIYLGR